MSEVERSLKDTGEVSVRAQQGIILALKRCQEEDPQALAELYEAVQVSPPGEVRMPMRERLWSRSLLQSSGRPAESVAVIARKVLVMKKSKGRRRVILRGLL